MTVRTSTATGMRYHERGIKAGSIRELRLKARGLAKTVVDLTLLPRPHTEKQRLDKLQTMREVISAICRFRGRGTIFANQEPSELDALVERLLARPPKVVLEIGTAKGGTLYLWSRIVAPGSLIISIDKPGETGSVGKSTLAVYKSFGRDRDIEILPIAADSHSEGAHRMVLAALAGRAVDFLFIDGDHSYEGVKVDFYEYRKYMAPEGFIALHDIAVGPTNPEIQVGRFWSELKGRETRTGSLVSKPGHSPGVGLVFLD